MTRIVLSLCLLLFAAMGLAQAWTPEQLAAANTAANIRTISEAEKDVIKYINLARLYPQQFAEQEVAGYTATEMHGDKLAYSSYRKSLLADLNGMKPVRALTFDQAMYNLAVCFARESGKEGLVGHERKQCKDGYMGECCSYGMAGAKDVAMQWLIDENIKSLGHRKICLDDRYHTVGIAMQPHKTYRFCAVADFDTKD